MNSAAQNQHFVQILGLYTGELLAGGQMSQKASVQVQPCAGVDSVCLSYFPTIAVGLGVMREVEG